jgi:hypothetical protein
MARQNKNLTYDGRCLYTYIPTGVIQPLARVAGNDVYWRYVDYTGPKSYPLQDHAYELEAIETRHVYGTQYEFSSYTGQPIRKYEGFLGIQIGKLPNDRLPNYTNLYNDLLSKARSRLAGDLNLGASIGEARQLYDMLKGALTPKGILTQAAKLLKQQSKSKDAAAKATMSMKQIGGKHLEVAYGWKPFASDLYGICGNLLEHGVDALNTKRKISVWQGFGREKVAGGYPLNPEFYDYDHGSGKRILSMRVVFSNSNFTDSMVAWSSLNPALIAWELMPLSFVFDWFFDVSGFMSNMEFQLYANTRFKGGTLTELIFYNYIVLVNNKSSVTSISGKGSIKYRYIKRTILTSYPSPKIPRFRMDLGSAQLLNAAALLSQSLK